MASSHSPVACWALIIGINHYPSDRCLHGAVQDARVTKHQLEEAATPVSITILTATSPSDSRSPLPVEEPQQWPTYANVISGLQKILSAAKPRDLVYIHFSGHGTRIRDEAPLGSESTELLSLVLFDDNELGATYLRGRILASVLQKMVAQGLVVTFVLDCCFSGSVGRHGDGNGFEARAVDYRPEIDAVSPPKLESTLLPESTARTAKMARDWLVDPDGYTILSACGPYETAYEVEVEGEGRRGALTYFLFQTLRTLGNGSADISCRSLHERLCARFHASWPQQMPMFYGNRNLTILGSLATAPDPSQIAIRLTDDRHLCLQAGQVHGICTDDEFAVCPGQSQRIADQAEGSTLLKVTAVRCFESDLVAVSPTFAVHQIPRDSTVRRTTCPSSRKTRARLLPGVGNSGQWKQVAEHVPFLHLSAHDEREPCLFNVSVNDNHEYEIVDALYCKIVGLPTIPVDSSEAVRAGVDVLQHLAIFKYLEGLENRQPSMTFRASFSLKFHSATGASGVFEVKHHDIWSFTVENVGDRSLYLAIFNFNPSWEIVNLVSSSGGDDYVVIPPKSESSGKKPVKIQMEVPEVLQSNGQGRCEDIMKVFVTSQPTSFPFMILPKMLLDTHSLYQRARSADDLSKGPAELTASLRGQDAGTGDWYTQNFIIRTTLD